MTYQTILTSKGTTTIPVEIRHKLGIEPGMQVTFEEDLKTGRVYIGRALTIQELRKLNKAAMKKAGTLDVEYKRDGGFEKYLASRSFK